MKRIHLFEFEDFNWFPNWLRSSLTRLINVMHRLLNTDEEIAEKLSEILLESEQKKLVDLCSGSGGPMPNVFHLLSTKYGIKGLSLTLTDLYPNINAAELINSENNSITYQKTSVDASDVDSSLGGQRTMICSFHHMDKQTARKILKDAFTNKQALFILEISDNSFPKWLWWISIPINFIMCFFITPFVKPLTWYQLVFTYIIPIIPIFYAWDGAVSNARTYTLEDLDQLLEGLESTDYRWEKGIIKGKSRKIFLSGNPL